MIDRSDVIDPDRPDTGLGRFMPAFGRRGLDVGGPVHPAGLPANTGASRPVPGHFTRPPRPVVNDSAEPQRRGHLTLRDGGARRHSGPTKVERATGRIGTDVAGLLVHVRGHPKIARHLGFG